MIKKIKQRLFHPLVFALLIIVVAGLLLVASQNAPLSDNCVYGLVGVFILFVWYIYGFLCDLIDKTVPILGEGSITKESDWENVDDEK